MQTLRKFSLGLFVVLGLALTSCMGDLPEASTAQEHESNMKLQETYAPFVGSYGGYLTDNIYGEPDVPVRLDLFLAREANGRNENGQTKFVVVLQALYRRLDSNDPAYRYFIRSVGYNKETNLLHMERPDGQGGQSGVGYLYIEGRVQGNSFVGELRNHLGPQGILRLERLASSPSEQ